MQTGRSILFCDLQIEICLYEIMEISERLRLARFRAGYSTAKDAARRLGVPYGTYSGHESGTRGIKKDDIERYGRAFNVDVGWLAFGAGGQASLVIHQAEHIGFIDKSGTYRQFGDPENPKFQNRFPALPVRSGPQAVVTVEGDTLHGFAEDEWLIYLSFVDVKKLDNKIGHICLCHTGTEEYGSVIGWLQRGSLESRFNIERVNQPTIRDTEIIGANHILGIMTDISHKLMKEGIASRSPDNLNLSGRVTIPPFKEVTAHTGQQRESAKSS